MELPIPSPENAETFKKTLERLRSVYLEIREIQTSSSSRSHAGPTLTLRSLNREKERLEYELRSLT